VVARAPTGSGKTLAYLLPALHRVLAADKGKAGWQALVLVPTRELCEQVREEAASVASLCGSELTVSAVAGDTPLRALCATAGQLVVTTPAKLAQALREGILTPRVLQERLQVCVGQVQQQDVAPAPRRHPAKGGHGHDKFAADIGVL
jgi:ATP-dependent RNA helicase DDX56/DBP9